MNRTYLSRTEQLLLFAMIFIILQEWLKPVMQLTGTGYFNLFSTFVALCLLISLFEWPLVISWTLKLLFTFNFIFRIYDYDNLGLVAFFKKELEVNFNAIWNAEWVLVTNGFRTFLFYILIWMLVYLIHHWITVRMSIFYFLVMTVFFIATLDTFSSYDGKIAIIKVVTVGLIMTALLFLKRFILKRNILIDWNAIFKMMIPVAIAVIFIGSVAYLMPKAAPQWPDPVNFIKGYGSGDGIGNGDGDGEIQKVGYGDNDEQLGGSFVADDTVVFNVTAGNKQYWRVETKDIYTSKGWKSSNPSKEGRQFSSGDTIYTRILPGPAESTEQAEIVSLAGYDFILQPYGIMGVEDADSTSVQLVRESERLEFSDQKDQYNVIFSEPHYNYETLKASTVVNEGLTQYIQLPDTLPDRVIELAERITANSASAYEKARAIERYFGLNGYTYNTTNVAIPGEDQDYVDQFLFDTKVGYCDNFSTSMVVMLRAVGIPAVWVKGFVTGDMLDLYDDDKARYEITNNEAHSWVEAYIDGVGWMPFEPTIGYANPANIDYDISTEDDELTVPDDEEEETLEQPNQELDKAGAGAEQNNSISFAWLKAPLIVLVAIAAIVGSTLWFTRKKWLPKYYIRRYRKAAPTEESYVVAYERLLKQLANYGLKRNEDQTLSSYAKKVDEFFNTKDMSKLTDVYEALIYAKNVNPIEFDKMKESWEYLINRSIG